MIVCTYVFVISLPSATGIQSRMCCGTGAMGAPSARGVLMLDGSLPGPFLFSRGQQPKRGWAQQQQPEAPAQLFASTAGECRGTAAGLPMHWPRVDEDQVQNCPARLTFPDVTSFCRSAAEVTFT